MTILTKDPWLAVNLSMFFPGMGHLYAGKILRGLVFIAIQALLIAIAFWSIFDSHGNTLIGLFFLCIVIVVYLFNILDAHLCTYRQRGDATLEKIPRKQKNPWFAVCVSRILPGLGHLYINQSGIGIIFVFSSLMLLRLDDFFPALVIISPTITAIATYHNYITFPQRQQRFYRSVLAIIVGLTFACGLIINYFPNWIQTQFDLFTIPSESMQPTLQIGDRILVHQSDTYQPQKGDVVVFKASKTIKLIDGSSQQDTYFVKRVIATSGQIVHIKDGRVYINDQPINEPYIAQPPDYEWGPQLVPTNSYFMLGDNRNNSFDSHVWGFLSKNDLVGQAYKIAWPPKRIQSLL